MMELEIVGKNKEYSSFVRELRNNKEIKTGFIQQEHIAEAEHETHMTLELLKKILELQHTRTSKGKVLENL